MSRQGNTYVIGGMTLVDSSIYFDAAPIRAAASAS